MAALAALAAAAFASPALGAFPGEDGRIAFVRDGDVWTVTPDGAGQAPLTTRAVPDDDPEWSPDGLTVLFTRTDGAQRLVHAIGSDGQGVQNLGAGIMPDFSPDGASIVFTRELPDANPASGSVPHSPLFVMARDGTGARQIDLGLRYSFAADWSAAGIAYHNGTDDGGARVRILGADGSAGAVLAPGASSPHPGHDPDEYDSRDASWSPDGRRLVMRLEQNLTGACHPQYLAPCPDPNVGLVVVDADGGGRQVIPGTSDAHDPAWSPSGTRIAFSAERTGQREIWVTNLDGSGQRRVTTGGGTQPDWQPIGPVPAVGAVTGAPVAGAGATSLAVEGSGFVPRSVVRWNGAPRPTAYEGPRRLTVSLSAADVAAPGQAALTVFTSPAGGGESAPVTVTISPTPVPPPPALSIARATFVVSWRQSRPRGRLVVRGTSGRAGRVEIVARRGSRVALRRVVAVPAGRFTRSVLVRGRLMPGRYVVGIREVGGAPGIAALTGDSRPLRLAPPPEGVVRIAAVSTVGRNGPAAVRIAQARRLDARFVFAARPRPGRRLTTTWYRDGRHVPGTTVGRARRARIDAVVISPRGRLPRGRWTCVLRAGRKAVATTTIRIG